MAKQANFWAIVCALPSPLVVDFIGLFIGCFDLAYILCTSVFTSITDFVFISYMFRASHLSF